MQWVVYELTDDHENYPTGIYRLVGPFDDLRNAWQYCGESLSDGVFALEPPMGEKVPPR